MLPAVCHVLADGDLRVVVDAAIGGRLASLEVRGEEVLVTAGAGLMYQGCFPMAPYAGRVRNGRFTHDGVTHRLPLTGWPNAMHGTVLDVPWEVEDAGRSHCSLVAPLGSRWPFAGEVRHRVELAGDEVRLRLEVVTDGEPFPASAGWHPWFRRRLDSGATAALDLDAGSMWERGDDDLPTGRLVPPTPGPWDDCFTDLAAPPTLRWPGALRLEVRSPCPHVVVFDERPEAVCVEPQTAPPDALNLAPRLVTPAEPLVAEATLVLTPDRAG